MYVCMYVYMNCVYAYMYVSMCVSKWVYYACTYAEIKKHSMHKCIFLYVCSVYVCMYVWTECIQMYMCMYV